MRRISTSPLTASSTRASESFRKSWWIRNGGAERNGQRGNGGSTYRPIFARETENITFTSAAGHSNARIRSPDGKGTILRARARSLRSGFRSRTWRSEEHTSELHHLGISYAVFCLKKKKQ